MNDANAASARVGEPFTCGDLVQASIDHVAFLRNMHKIGITTAVTASVSFFTKSFDRYVNCWLPLVAESILLSSLEKSSAAILTPPADIAWLWHCHRLAPLEYEKYIRERFQQPTLPSQQQHALLQVTPRFSFQTSDTYERKALIVRLLWKQRYPNESFFLDHKNHSEEEAARNGTEHSQDEAAAVLEKCKEELDGYSLFNSCRAQVTFLWNVCLPHYGDSGFLLEGSERYHKFLKLCRVMDRSMPLVPTFQIDLLWHTHILISSVAQYNQDCIIICGRKFRHDDSFNDRSTGGSLEKAFAKTCELWWNEYQTEYIVPGAMYRGEPPDYYYDYESWDPDVAFHYYVRRRHWRSWMLRPWVTPTLTLPSFTAKSDRSKIKSSILRSTSTISWRELLEARGSDLWTIREKGLLLHNRNLPTTGKKESNGCNQDDMDNESLFVVLPIHPRYTRRRRWRIGRQQPLSFVKVIGNASTFITLESHGMDKGRMETQVTGDEWVRHRELIAKRALSTVKEWSVAAVNTVQWEDLLEREIRGVTNGAGAKTTGVFVVDLKQLVASACLDWVTRLFQGHDDVHDSNPGNKVELAEAFKQFWRESRALRKNAESLRNAQTHLIQCIERDHSSGLFQRIFEQDGLTAGQASMNCVNAMMAAFDTTLVIVFWTICNLALTNGAWEKVRCCKRSLTTSSTTSDDCVSKEGDLEELAEIKKLANQGKAVNVSSLSFLGRSIVETARVFPPVWTLPRVTADGEYAKLDVAWVNGAFDHRDWNPDRQPNEKIHIASFGLGKRHCPGGTAALWAAHSLIHRFVQEFESPQECEPGRAIQSLYLGPTLCMEGPQYFELRQVRAVRVV